MRNEIVNSLQQKGDLLPVPEVILALQNLTNDPNCNVDDIHRLLKADLVLSGKIITMSNSSYYAGGREKADNLQEAIVRLGVYVVLDICYAAELPKAFEKSQTFDQAQFWKHSLATGYLSSLLANKLINEQKPLDASFLSGLVHDVGILVLDYLIPEEYNKFLSVKDISSSEQPIEMLEREFFGIDHQELGGMFLQKWWQLPSLVIETVTDHHRNLINDSNGITLAHIVNAANKLANEHEISHPLMTQYKEEVSEEFLLKTGIENSELALFVEKTKIGLLAFEDLFDS
ncbi:MAG: HD-like signal output (HDOD) protein [Parvicellaceae bacterium]|jgi:HD-like signal output (HDOD) protein